MKFANGGLTTYFGFIYTFCLESVSGRHAVKVGQSVVLLDQGFMYADHASVLLAQDCYTHLDTEIRMHSLHTE